MIWSQGRCVAVLLELIRPVDEQLITEMKAQGNDGKKRCMQERKMRIKL